MDALAQLLTGVRARSAAFCRAVLDPPWSWRIADHAPLALATTVAGEAWIVPDSGEPVRMKTGDVAIVKGPEPYTVCDSPGNEPDIIVHQGNRLTTPDGVDVTDEVSLGPRTAGTPDGSAVVASGTYQVAGDVSTRLLDALPHILVVPEADARGPVMQLLSTEVGSDVPGQQAMLDRLLDLALIAALRAWFDRPDAHAPGWYVAQGDPVVGPALRLMHDDVGHTWTVDALAKRVGTSRATFARRFTKLVGEPPLAYLTSWRLAYAADLLRSTDETLEAIARRVGYANAFAFSVAFKREREMSPKAYRATASDSHVQ